MQSDGTRLTIRSFLVILSGLRETTNLAGTVSVASSSTRELTAMRLTTLYATGADPNALYTMTCLEGQLVKVLGLNPARLTINDFEQLYRAKFRELNEEILGENLCFVEAMQNYERDRQEYERIRILRRQHTEMQDHLQQQQRPELFDSPYSSPSKGPNQGPYVYDLPAPSDPSPGELLNKLTPIQGHRSRMDLEHPSIRSRGQSYWSPVKLPPLDTTQESSPSAGPRSPSQSSPVHFSPMGTDRYSRSRGNSHAESPRLIMTDATQVYYSTPSHGSSPTVSSAGSQFPNP